MQVTIITLCLIGAVFANPILHNITVEPFGQGAANVTLSVSVSQSSEIDTSELQSSEESASSQSSESDSESESLESTSEDKTSEESESQSLEDTTASIAETKDNSLGSEENVRKSWITVFASVVRVQSEEDGSSTELSADTQKIPEAPVGSVTNLILSPKDSAPPRVDRGPASGDSSDSSDSTDAAPSSRSSSSESDEDTTGEDTTGEDTTSEDTTSEDTTGESAEDSHGSDSAGVEQVGGRNCTEAAASSECGSEEDFFQAIGDDGHFSVDHLMVPDEDHRELGLRR